MGEAGATIAALSSSSSTPTTTTTQQQQQQQQPSHTSLLLAPSSFDVEHPFPSLPDRCLHIRAQAVAALLLLDHRHGGAYMNTCVWLVCWFWLGRGFVPPSQHRE